MTASTSLTSAAPGLVRPAAARSPGRVRAAAALWGWRGLPWLVIFALWYAIRANGWVSPALLPLPEQI